jgi:hypothetical protein
MNTNPRHLRETIVGLADLIREVRLHGRTARFDLRAPGLLEEARMALVQTKDSERASTLPQTLKRTRKRTLKRTARGRNSLTRGRGGLTRRGRSEDAAREQRRRIGRP